MSTNVLVIPEDFRKDQYLLKPIVERMLLSAGVKRPRVRVCQELLGGLGEALKWKRISRIIDRYRGMTRLFLLIVDRDGQATRRRDLERLEKRASEGLAGGSSFLAENAWQEIEVWVLAGLGDLPKDWSWQEVRSEIHPKERFFEPYVASRGLRRAAYGGERC